MFITFYATQILRTIVFQYKKSFASSDICHVEKNKSIISTEPNL